MHRKWQGLEWCLLPILIPLLKEVVVIRIFLLIDALDFITKEYSVFSFKNSGLGKVNLVAAEGSVEVLTSAASTKT